VDWEQSVFMGVMSHSPLSNIGDLETWQKLTFAILGSFLKSTMSNKYN
jgi:hypothetical protein